MVLFPFCCSIRAQFAVFAVFVFLFSLSSAEHHEKHEVSQRAEGRLHPQHFVQVNESIIGNIARGALAGALGTLAGNPALGAPPGFPAGMAAMPGVGAAGAPQAGATAAGAPAAEAAPPPVDLDAVEAAQAAVDEEVENTTKLGNKLKEAVDMLSATTQSHVRKGIDYSATVVQPPPPPEEQTGTEITAAAAAEENLYTAPVIILLPSEPTPTEKMEFARATACLGKLNSPEMRQARSAELTEMATIKGKTISELEREITQTQEELSKSKAERRRVQQELRQVASNAIEGTASQADVLFLKHDVQLADEKITVYLDKLKRLEVKLARMRSQEEQEERSSSKRNMQEEEIENLENTENRRKKTSSKGRTKPQKTNMKAATAKAKKPKAKTIQTTKNRTAMPDKKSRGKPKFTETEIAEGQQQSTTITEQQQQLMDYQYHLQQMQLEMQRLQQEARDEKIKEIPTHRQEAIPWRKRGRRGAT